MSKHNFSNDSDQHDSKIFKENLGSFGTTTQPGGNQLTELQTKIRQGVKHVELHLAGTGKGSFGTLEVPDKYGFEQRRTIMQLAKLNKQTLSVHGTFDVTDFSGINQNGFDEAERFNAIKEIDETLKFASETSKQGAVVFHIQGTPISNDRSELNLSKKYLTWLKKNNQDEYLKIQKEYFDSNNLNRKFVSNIEKEKEIRTEFNNLKQKNSKKYNYYLDLAKNLNENRSPWEYYYMEKDSKKRKLTPDRNPMVLIGDKMEGVQRQQEFVDLSILKNEKKLNNTDKEILKKLDISSKNIGIEDYQKIQAIFTSNSYENLDNKINKEDFQKLKNKILVNYDKIYSNENNSLSHADEAFMKKLLEHQIDLVELQKEDFEENKLLISEEHLKEYNSIENRKKKIAIEIKEAKRMGNKKKILELSEELSGNGENNRGLIWTQEFLKQRIGPLIYDKFIQSNDVISKLNQQKKELEEQKEDINAVTDVIFERNTSSIAHLGIKALRYQLDLKEKSKTANGKILKINSKIKELEKDYEKTNSIDEQDIINDKINREKYERRVLIGLEDYKDIDLINKPLYLAPENMLPGMGSLTSIEEFKATIRMSQLDFAEKILSNEKDYKILKGEYEKETGIKISTKEDALNLAKRHIGGTFDNAHAAVWIKHFKKEEGESEEHKIDRFNKWLNSQGELMVREGIVKHVHFNDTQAKADDHNLLGNGILDLHDLRHRLRKAGLKEPLIVEAGGRGTNSNLHILNAFNIFNPSLKDNNNYTSGLESPISSGVSNWIDVERNYNRRPQYSFYGMGYSAFKNSPSQNPNQRGGWSGTNFF